MFEDEWRDAPTCVGLKCSWDRYVLCTALWCGWSLAIASSAFHFAQSPSTVLAAAPFLLPCTDATDLARWLLSISCLQLLSLAVVSSLRDRRDSLQETAVFVLKGTMAVVLLLALLPALALTIVLAVSLSAYSSSSSASCLAPSASFLFVTSAVSVPLSALASLTSLYALLSIVYARLIFMQPPVKRLSSTQEADAITWIRARNGVVIPTLLIVPPTVDLSLTVPGLFPCSTVLLYSHGNAMDLGDSVYVLRAMAETFDCAVLGYEYAGYGLCQGSVSEDGCNAAIEAAYHCLVDYHHAQASQIILYGRSLGTGPSTHLAHTLQSALGGMVLQSPMLSVVRAGCRVVGRTLPFDLFPTVDLIASLTLPVFLLHGEKDTVVPFTHALALQALVSPASAFPPLWVADGDHHNMPKPVRRTHPFTAPSAGGVRPLTVLVRCAFDVRCSGCTPLRRATATAPSGTPRRCVSTRVMPSTSRACATSSDTAGIAQSSDCSRRPSPRPPSLCPLRRRCWTPARRRR